jgi:hypothetical protein
MAVFKTTDKLSSVVTAVFPFVLSEAFGLAINILTNEYVSVREEVRTITMSEALLPFSLVLIAISPDMDSVTISFRIVPLAYVALSMDTFPDTISNFSSIFPLSIVDFATLPGINSFTLGSASDVFSLE